MILDAYPGKRFSGTITDVLNNAEEKNQWGKTNYFRASISLDSVDQDIMKPGMSVKCLVRTARYTGVRLVPLAVTYHDGKNFWIKPRGKELKKIKIIGFNCFYVALPNAAGSGRDLIAQGDVLEPVDPADAAKRIGAAEQSENGDGIRFPKTGDSTKKTGNKNSKKDIKNTTGKKQEKAAKLDGSQLSAATANDWTGRRGGRS
jgi:hypothetical protein